MIHPLLDLALDWRAANPGVEIDRVEVRGNPLLLQRTDRPDIATGREAQVSLQHATAAALLFGKAGLNQFTDACVNDPKVKALRGRITVSADPNISTIAMQADFFGKDGRKQSLSTDAARGSAANPLKDKEIEQKLRDEAASWSATHDIQKLIDAVWTLDRSDDVGGLARLAVPV